MEEIWKDVPNYEGLYQVSNLGRVKSLRYGKQIILKQSTTKGYYMVKLQVNKHKKSYRVHQLVAMVFLNHTPCGHELVVDHINGDKTDNCLDNLQIITQRYNAVRSMPNYIKNKTSKYIGVYFSKSKNRWISEIKSGTKKYYLGTFKCELAAAVAYQNKLKTL